MVLVGHSSSHRGAGQQLHSPARVAQFLQFLPFHICRITCCLLTTLSGVRERRPKRALLKWNGTECVSSDNQLAARSEAPSSGAPGTNQPWAETQALKQAPWDLVKPWQPPNWSWITTNTGQTLPSLDPSSSASSSEGRTRDQALVPAPGEEERQILAQLLAAGRGRDKLCRHASSPASSGKLSQLLSHIFFSTRELLFPRPREISSAADYWELEKWFINFPLAFRLGTWLHSRAVTWFLGLLLPGVSRCLEPLSFFFFHMALHYCNTQNCFRISWGYFFAFLNIFLEVKCINVPFPSPTQIFLLAWSCDSFLLANADISYRGINSEWGARQAQGSTCG